ncbi:hypothetical protein TRVL_02342 [Trypanosoma vivax]|nr:hypothetical protein TRVL_02342 [Trypanosoma vivax]
MFLGFANGRVDGVSQGTGALGVTTTDRWQFRRKECENKFDATKGKSGPFFQNIASRGFGHGKTRTMPILQPEETPRGDLLCKWEWNARAMANRGLIWDRRGPTLGQYLVETHRNAERRLRSRQPDEERLREYGGKLSGTGTKQAEGTTVGKLTGHS